MTFTRFWLVICLPSPRKVKPVHRGGGVGGRLCFPGSLSWGREHLKILQTCVGDTGEHRTICAMCMSMLSGGSIDILRSLNRAHSSQEAVNHCF